MAELLKPTSLGPPMRPKRGAGSRREGAAAADLGNRAQLATDDLLLLPDDHLGSG
jgi:hypothetical protein